MIKGIVTANLHAELHLLVLGARGKRRIRAIIDTGYNGWLTLPPTIIAELGLTWQEKGSADLADGSETTFDIFAGQIVWNRRKQFIPVDEAVITPLVGTGLLENHKLVAEFREGGEVTITPLS